MRGRIQLIFNLSCLMIVFGALFTYARYESKELLDGPQISIASPQNGMSVKDDILNVGGQTKNVTSINLNGRPIFIDQNGIFKERLLLSEGYNTISLKASDRFGKETTKTIEIILSKENIMSDLISKN